MMIDRNQLPYSDLCEALAIAFGKPESSVDGRTHTWTFTPEPIQLTATVYMPPVGEVHQAILDVMAEKGNHVKL